MTEWYEKPYAKNPNPPSVSLPRTLFSPAQGEGFYNGQDVTAMKRAVSRLGRWPWDPSGWDDGYADTFAFGKTGNVKDTGVKGVQRQMKLAQDGILGPGTFEVLRTSLIPDELPNGGQPAFDQTALNLLRSYAPPPSGGAINLGPVYGGGKSMMNHDLTHVTGGLPNYPAFDDCFKAGVSIIAPEDLTVTGQSSSSPGDAFYAEGKSGLLYWFGHLTGSPSNGSKFKKGAKIGTVLDHDVGGGPHVHVGVDGRPVLGHQFAYHNDYTHGAPTIGKQLEDA